MIEHLLYAPAVLDPLLNASAFSPFSLLPLLFRPPHPLFFLLTPSSVSLPFLLFLILITAIY